MPIVQSDTGAAVIVARNAPRRFPVAVKKNSVATGSDFAHARVQPDIEVVRLKFMNHLELSRSSEVRLPLLWLALLRPDQRVACGQSAA